MKNTVLLVIITGVLLTGCGGGDGSGGSGLIDSGNDKDTYMGSLPNWSEFAPPERALENEGAEMVDESVPPTIEELLGDDGNVKVCTTETVSFYDTPEEYVMFSPPTQVLYPGALIQGKSIRNGSEFLPLLVDQRTPVQVSIPDCNIANNFRSVQPALENVNAAVSEILSDASSQGVNCATPSGSFTVETYRNEQHRALTAGLSGRYWGFSGNANTSYNKTTLENSVSAIFRESLFRVQIEAPQTPGQWFSEDFTPDLLQEQIDLDRIGSDNIPAYVAEVVYGRLMTATMTSSLSEQDMKLTMEFKYRNPTSEVELDSGLSTSEVLQQSRFVFAYYGGSAVATGAALKSGNWNDYFGTPATADDALPISFVIKSTIDNVPAVVQEFTEYDRTVCYDKLADDATFTLLAEQEFTPGFSTTGQVVASGDVNGDGYDDVVWASTSSRGEFAISYSNGDGTFSASQMYSNPNVADFDGNFHMFVADINDDNRKDIVFNVLPDGVGDNKVSVSFYDDSLTDGFLHSNSQVLGTGGSWNTYRSYSAQLDGLNGVDLIINNVPESTTTNRTYIATSVNTKVNGFDLATDPLFAEFKSFDHPARNFSGYEYTHISDFTGDGRADLVWQNIDGNGNGLYAATGTVDGGLKFAPYQSFPSTWSGYIAFSGDANGDGKADLIEPRHNSLFKDFGTYFGQGTDIGNVVIGAHTFTGVDQTDDAAITDLIGRGPDPVRPDMFLADVNGDGSKDMIINDLGYADNLTNTVAVGLSIPGGSSFNYVRAAQSFDELRNWQLYQVLVADINGDQRDDLIWINNGPTNSVYVGVARGN